jgi:hypothetical protein
VPKYVKYVADQAGHRWQYLDIMWKYGIRNMRYLAWQGIGAGVATKLLPNRRG